MKLTIIVLAILLVAPLGRRAGCQPPPPQATPLSLPRHNDMGGNCPGEAWITIGYPEKAEDAQNGALIFLELPNRPTAIQADQPFPKYNKDVKTFRRTFDLDDIPPESCGTPAKLYYLKDSKPSQPVDVVLPRLSDAPTKKDKIIVSLEPPQIDCGKATDVLIRVTNGNIASLGQLHIGNRPVDSVSATAAQAKGVIVPCDGPETLAVAASEPYQAVSLPALKIKRSEKSIQDQIADLKSAMQELNTRIDKLDKHLKEASDSNLERMLVEIGTGLIITLLVVGFAYKWHYRNRLQAAIKELREEFTKRWDSLDVRFKVFKAETEKKFVFPAPGTPRPQPNPEGNFSPNPGHGVQDIHPSPCDDSLENSILENASNFSFDQLVRDYNNALEDTSRHDKFIKRYQAHRIAIKNQVEVTRSSSTPVFSEDEKGDLYAIPCNHVNYVVPALDRIWTGDTVRVWDSSFEIREASARRLTSPAEAVQRADGWRIAKKGKLERIP